MMAEANERVDQLIRKTFWAHRLANTSFFDSRKQPLVFFWKGPELLEVWKEKARFLQGRSWLVVSTE